jgi:hypothetical protein
MDGWVGVKAVLRIAYSNQQNDPNKINTPYISQFMPFCFIAIFGCTNFNLFDPGSVLALNMVVKTCLSFNISPRGRGDFAKILQHLSVSEPPKRTLRPLRNTSKYKQ